MFIARIVWETGMVEERELPAGNDGVVTLRRNSLPQTGIRQVELHSKTFTARAGEEGYFLIPSVENDGASALTLFREREDTESAFRLNIMPLFAVSTASGAVLAVVEGMPFEYELVAGVRGGRYYLFPRFLFSGEDAVDDIRLRLFRLPASERSYSALARCYRRYRLESGQCRPLRERLQEQPVLARAAAGPEVRIRMAWKPVPSPVAEQTEENEPPIKVKVPFELAERIVEKFHAAGISEAEFCLVGWNKSGHDGKFPDLLPVEPLLGGEEKMRHLIARTKELGYLISAHTCPYSGYTLAKRFHPEDRRLARDGSPQLGAKWGGGQAYRLCPERVYHTLIGEDVELLRNFGFNGIHYLDVYSILIPEPCCDPRHPLTRDEAAEWSRKTLEFFRDGLGGVASEGGWDFCAGSLDYVLYPVFHLRPELPAICDRTVPFWHLVYHGILLYNSACDTVNAAVKSDRRLFLRNMELGGRPLDYFYADFVSNGEHWLGCEDLICETEEALERGVRAVKAEFDRYRELADLQFEFIEEHEELSGTLVRVRYSNGDELLINYAENETPYEEIMLPPLSVTRRRNGRR